MAIPTPAPTRSGQYASAKLTRATTIGDLAYQKYQSGDDTNVVGSYVQAAREKLRARSVAMKERFDPLNLVQKATGSKILTAAAGRAMGRSSDDVDYFNKKSEEGKKPKGTGGPRDARERFIPGISGDERGADFRLRQHADDDDVAEDFGFGGHSGD